MLVSGRQCEENSSLISAKGRLEPGYKTRRRRRMRTRRKRTERMKSKRRRKMRRRKMMGGGEGEWGRGEGINGRGEIQVEGGEVKLEKEAAYEVECKGEDEPGRRSSRRWRKGRTHGTCISKQSLPTSCLDCLTKIEGDSVEQMYRERERQSQKERETRDGAWAARRFGHALPSGVLRMKQMIRLNAISGQFYFRFVSFISDDVIAFSSSSLCF